MSSDILQAGKQMRPSFNHAQDYSYAAVTAQMLESIRNVLEDIQRSQMMQCDVAWAIKETRDILKRREREENARYLRRNGFKEAAAKLLRRKK